MHKSHRSKFHLYYVFIYCAAIFINLLLVNIATAAVVDIMLVYDASAATWVSTNGGMGAFSQDAVNRMNQAMQNSELNHSFRLVHSMAVNYTTASDGSTPLSADLNSLKAGTGVFADVHLARETYKADLVAMLVDTGSSYGYVGTGYLLTSWTGAPDYGFTVNAIRSVEISHTLTHEVGHNLGAHHSKDQASAPGPNPYLDNQYSAGWYFTGTNGTSYHTIMAYNNDGFGNYYQSSPMFSTPIVPYQGIPAGHPADGDNGRLINQTIATIAGYRNSVVSLIDLTISGPASINENSSANYTATASWSDGSTTSVSPTWSENSAVATINSAGVFTTSLVSTNQSVIITASYTSGGVTRSDTQTVIVLKSQASGSFPWSLFLPAILRQNEAPDY